MALFPMTNFASGSSGSDYSYSGYGLYKTSSERDTEHGIPGAAHLLKATLALRNDEAVQKFNKDVTVHAFGENVKETFGATNGYGVVNATIVFLVALANVKELSADKDRLIYRVSIQAIVYGSYHSAPDFWHRKEQATKEDLDNWKDSPVSFNQTCLLNFVGNCSNTNSKAGVIPVNLDCDGDVREQDIKYLASGKTTEPAEYWKKIIDSLVHTQSGSVLSIKWYEFIADPHGDKAGKTLRSAWKHGLLPSFQKKSLQKS